tara:strand:- start:1075 stop:1266 length:192 start_codon:yes stop_codon:yes gene_type:complete
LCENNRFFEETRSEKIEDFLMDFYSETMIDSEFLKQSDEQKKHTLDTELFDYFQILDLERLNL